MLEEEVPLDNITMSKDGSLQLTDEITSSLLSKLQSTEGVKVVEGRI